MRLSSQYRESIDGSRGAQKQQHRLSRHLSPKLIILSSPTAYLLSGHLFTAASKSLRHQKQYEVSSSHTVSVYRRTV